MSLFDILQMIPTNTMWAFSILLDNQEHIERVLYL